MKAPLVEMAIAPRLLEDILIGLLRGADINALPSSALTRRPVVVVVSDRREVHTRTQRVIRLSHASAHPTMATVRGAAVDEIVRLDAPQDFVTLVKRIVAGLD